MTVQKMMDAEEEGKVKTLNNDSKGIERNY